MNCFGKRLAVLHIDIIGSQSCLWNIRVKNGWVCLESGLIADMEDRSAAVWLRCIINIVFWGEMTNRKLFSPLPGNSRICNAFLWWYLKAILASPSLYPGSSPVKQFHYPALTGTHTCLLNHRSSQWHAVERCILTLARPSNLLDLQYPPFIHTTMCCQSLGLSWVLGLVRGWGFSPGCVGVSKQHWSASERLMLSAEWARTVTTPVHALSPGFTCYLI